MSARPMRRFPWRASPPTRSTIDRSGMWIPFSVVSGVRPRGVRAQRARWSRLRPPCSLGRRSATGRRCRLHLPRPHHRRHCRHRTHHPWFRRHPETRSSDRHPTDYPSCSATRRPSSPPRDHHSIRYVHRSIRSASSCPFVWVGSANRRPCVRSTRPGRGAQRDASDVHRRAMHIRCI
jgi:hypothetical protein